MGAQLGGFVVEPAWAKGAKVFAPVSPSMLPPDVDLRPYDVLIRKCDVPSLEAALEHLPYKQRPRNARGPKDIPLAYSVVRTFVCTSEPCVFTPRSRVTQS